MDFLSILYLLHSVLTSSPAHTLSFLSLFVFLSLFLFTSLFSLYLSLSLSPSLSLSLSLPPSFSPSLSLYFSISLPIFYSSESQFSSFLDRYARVCSGRWCEQTTIQYRLVSEAITSEEHRRLLDVKQAPRSVIL